MTRLLHLAAQARALSLDQAPDGVRSRLRSQRMSALSAAAGGRSFPGANALLDVLGVRDGEHRILPGLGASSTADAIEAAVALSSAWGEDPALLPARPGGLAWVALLAGAALDRSWADVERAQLVGNELSARLAGACLGGRRPLRTGSLVLTFGSAVTAGILLDLPEPKLAHAMALALSRVPAEGAGATRSGARWLGAGRAARLGWDCARLADRGLEGRLDDDLAELIGGRVLAGWWSGMGSTWLTSTMTHPATPGSPFLAPAHAALAELVADLDAEGQDLRPADVLRIDVDVAMPTAAMELQLGRHSEARNEQDAPAPAAFLHSVSRGLSLAAALGHAPTIDDLRPAGLARSWPGARDLSRRVHVRHDWRLTLAAWDSLRSHLPIDRLMEGVGPSALLTAARRVGSAKTPAGDGVGAAGPPGGGAGMAWSELPLALAAERLGPRGAELSEELIDDPAGTLGKGLEKLAGWASRRVERLMEAEGGPLSKIGKQLTTPRRASLDEANLAGLILPIPARVRVLENGGRVREAEVTGLRGVGDDVLKARLARRLPRLDPTLLTEGTPRALLASIDA